MIYGYARVSTKEQNLDRQLEEFKKYEIDKIYTEKDYPDGIIKSLFKILN